jgi:hypothetical protein
MLNTMLNKLRRAGVLALALAAGAVAFHPSTAQAADWRNGHGYMRMDRGRGSAYGRGFVAPPRWEHGWRGPSIAVYGYVPGPSYYYAPPPAYTYQPYAYPAPAPAPYGYDTPSNGYPPNNGYGSDYGY